MAYPASLDNLPANHVDPPSPGSPEIIHAATINDLATAINAIEAILGINPQRGPIPTGVYSAVVDRLNGIELPTIKGVTLPYTAVLADMAAIINCNNSSASTVTIPPNSSVAFPISTQLVIRCGGAGTVTVVAGAGVTLQSRGGVLGSAGQFAMITCLKTGTDIWTVAGDIA